MDFGAVFCFVFLLDTVFIDELGCRSDDGIFRRGDIGDDEVVVVGVGELIPFVDQLTAECVAEDFAVVYFDAFVTRLDGDFVCIERSDFFQRDCAVKVCRGF